MRLLPALAMTLAACSAPETPTLSVVTFNTGTTETLPHDSDPDDGYSSEDAAISDQYYGDGLAWPSAVEAVTDYFAADPPEIVGFQEIFAAADCPNIPEEHHAGWFCEGWTLGDAGVPETVLGPDYEIACHPGKPDKCVAVHAEFGQLPATLEGAEIEGCGSGARVAWADVERVAGMSLRLVHVHGSSGLADDDQACRTAQFEAAFANLDTPAILLGDLNTDPGRWTDVDTSAAAFAEAADEAQLQFVTEVGEDAEPSYAGVVNIDHVLSDVFVGTCTTPGVTEGTDAVLDAVYFDHHPVRCEVR